jgi:hypothetical protein
LLQPGFAFTGKDWTIEGGGDILEFVNCAMSKTSKPNPDKPWCHRCLDHTPNYKKITRWQRDPGSHGTGGARTDWLCKVCDKDVRIPSKELGHMWMVNIILLIFSIIIAGVYYCLDRYLEEDREKILLGSQIVIGIFFSIMLWAYCSALLFKRRWNRWAERHEINEMQ